MPPSVTESALVRLEKLFEASADNPKLEKLRKLADEVVDNARSKKNTDLLSEQDLARGLELRADVCRMLGDYDEAKTDYVEALGLMSSTTNADEGIGRVCAGLAYAHELSGSTDQAKPYYHRAIAAFERLTPPAVMDIADISNNLAFIYEADDNFERAETLLLAALKAYRENMGPEHEQTAALYNNLGALYFKAEFDDRAKEMHELALAARTKIFGGIHGETAQSHGNLALVLVRQEKVEDGKKHFEKALEAFESNLGEYRDDYEIVAANYRDVLEAMKDEKAVTKLKARLLKQRVP
jgi:tetratricopeptide (TPR) repeat protein